MTQQVAIRSAGDGAQLLDVIARAASDTAVDVGKMEKLIELQERLLAREAKVAFDEAMTALQLKLPVIAKRGMVRNRHGEVQSTYALWEDINEALKPILHEFGFALTFRTQTSGDRVKVEGVLSHRAGHREATELELMADASGSKNSVQAMGSSLSYAKRYCATSLLNITTMGEDNDGSGAAEKRELDFLDAITSATDAVELDRIKREMVTSYGNSQKVPTALRNAYNTKRESIR